MNWLVITPDIEYKLRLIHDLLSSIHCDWSEGSRLVERHDLALKLCEDVINNLVTQNNRIIIYDKGINNKDIVLKLYRLYIFALTKLKETIEGFNPDGTQDGKYFRYTFPDGYYEMLKYFDLED